MSRRGETDMKWLRKIAWRITKRAWEDNDEFEREQQHKLASSATIRTGRGRGNIARMFETDEDDSPKLRASSMNFRLYACVGGHILETSVYNQKEDETEHTLYMIKDEDDFAKQVSQSIMLEMMKR
jgi:hypothetical protein